MLGLNQEAMDRVLTDSREYLETFAEALSIPKADIKGYFELLASANRELGDMYLTNQHITEEINRKTSLTKELNSISRYCLHEKNMAAAAKLCLRSLVTYFQFESVWLELYLNNESSMLCTSQRPLLFGEPSTGHGKDDLEEKEKIILRGTFTPEDDARLYPIHSNGDEEIGRIAIRSVTKTKGEEVRVFIDHLSLGLSNVRLHFTNRLKTENLNIAVKHLKEEYGRRQDLSALNQLILDASPIGIITTGIEGAIIQHNREAEHILLEPLGGKNLFKLQIFSHDDLKTKIGDIEKRRKTTQLTVFHEGRQHHFLVETAPIEGTAHTLMLINDISERIEEEKIFIQKEKMATLGELAAGIAHNLRSPLAVIKGIPELILSDVKSKTVKITRKTDSKEAPDREIEENLKLISKSMEKALSIIDGIMDFSKKEPGQYETFDLSRIIDEVYSLVEHKLQGKEISFSNNTESCRLYADRNMITQIFINLFNNSIHAIGDKGTIEASCKRDKGKMIIHFTDNGVGVEPEHLDQIFEPFFTTTGKANGTGIGLSITRKMVTLHGGSIKALPKKGGGTIIEIIFPEKAE
jgi:PAS domain S-box-containing protein